MANITLSPRKRNSSARFLPEISTSENEKYCPTCKTVKSKSEFNKQSKTNDGLHALCRSCQSDSNKRYMQSAHGKDRFRRYHLDRVYGLSVEGYNQMLAAQDGKCKICGTDDPKNHRNEYFCVDDCHTTGKVRSLLCGHCNSMIGLANDNVDILQKAIKYLHETN